MEISELRGATGVFSFDERGNVVRTVNLSTINDGKVVSEYVTKSEAEAAELGDALVTQEDETEKAENNNSVQSDEAGTAEKSDNR